MRQLRLRPRNGGWHSGAQFRASFLIGNLDGSAATACHLDPSYGVSTYGPSPDCHERVVQFLGTTVYADPLYPGSVTDYNPPVPYGAGFMPLLRVDLGQFEQSHDPNKTET